MIEKPTRQEAIARGLKRYYGKACAKHPELEGERWVSTWGCVECVREHNRKWRADNPEAVRESYQKWLAANATGMRARRHSYYAANAEAARKYALTRRNENIEAARENYRKYRAENLAAEQERARKYKHANRARATALERNRKASKLSRTPMWLTPDDFASISGLYAAAARVTRETGVPHEVDHIYPLQGKWVSGLHVPLNLQIISANDNRRKSNKRLEL